MCRDGHGLSIDVPFPQLFIWTSPLAYSHNEWFTYSCPYPMLNTERDPPADTPNLPKKPGSIGLRHKYS
jgi:hypothetical protein